MLELYRKRLSRTNGTSPSAAMKMAHDDMMDDSFVYDISYKRCIINGEYVDAKLHTGTNTDVKDDKPYFKLQFRPPKAIRKPDGTTELLNVFPIGTIVDVPENRYNQVEYDWWIEHEPLSSDYRGCYINESDGIHYRRWLIVDQPQDNQEQNYYVEQLDWCLNWLDKDGYLHKQLSIMRNRNSYSSGIYEKYYLTAVESQDAIWMPTNLDVKTLDYDQRFLISDNEFNPQAYKLTGIYTNHPVGMTKLILTQVVTENDDYYNKTKTDEFKFPTVACSWGHSLKDIDDAVLFGHEDIKEVVDLNIDLTNDSDDVAYVGYPITFNICLLKNGVEQDVQKCIKNNIFSIVSWDISFSNVSVDKYAIIEYSEDNDVCKISLRNSNSLATNKLIIKCETKYKESGNDDLHVLTCEKIIDIDTM